MLLVESQICLTYADVSVKPLLQWWTLAGGVCEETCFAL